MQLALHAQKKMLRVPRLYVYRDFFPFPDLNGHTGRFAQLIEELIISLQENENVILLDADEQIQKLASRTFPSKPFDVTLAIGEAGYKTAFSIHEKTGWLQNIQTFFVSRKEKKDGTYELISINHMDLQTRLNQIRGNRLAIIDDTIYSGFTLTRVLESLPKTILKNARVFCLQAISESLPKIQIYCPVSAGYEVFGTIDKEVSIIRFSHLFSKGAIRTALNQELAFFERLDWMYSWFPRNAAAITMLCKELYSMQKNSFGSL